MEVKNICTILARGGSKGVKNKNIKPLFGRPLIHYTIIQAKESKLFDTIIVSSDSNEILNIAGKIDGIELIKRPLEFANDKISKRPALRHAVTYAEKKLNIHYDNVIDLDCTSPLRSINDIHVAYKQFIQKNNDNLITAMPARRSPYFNMVTLDKTDNVKLVIEPEIPVTCRQDAPVCYDMNASIYIWKKDILFDTDSNYLEKTGLYIMPEDRSQDIDSDLDFKIVEMIMSEKRNA